MRILALATVVLLVAGVALAADVRPGEQDEARRRIAVVVGRTSFVTETSKDELRELYLRRQRLWPNGTRAIAINLPPEHPLRRAFSEIVLGRSPDELVAYWNARYFEGITPPTVLPSPAAVRAYVATEPGAIAYLPAGEVDSCCRVLLMLGE